MDKRYYSGKQRFNSNKVILFKKESKLYKKFDSKSPKIK